MKREFEELAMLATLDERVTALEAKTKEPRVSQNGLDNIYALVIRFDKIEKQFFALEHVTKCFFNDELMQAVNKVLTDRQTNDE